MKKLKYSQSFQHQIPQLKLNLFAQTDAPVKEVIEESFDHTPLDLKEDENVSLRIEDQRDGNQTGRFAIGTSGKKKDNHQKSYFDIG